MKTETGRVVSTVAGAAFLWLCLKSAALSVVRAIQGQACSLPAAAGLYLAYAVVLVVVAVCVSVLLSGRRTRGGEQAVSAISAVCGATGLLLALRASGVVLLAPALLLIGVFVGCHLALWSPRIVSCRADLVPFVVAASFLAAEIVRLLVTVSGADLLRAAYPVASFLLLLACPMGDRVAPATERASLTSLSWGMAVTCALLIALWSFALGMMPQGTGGVMSGEDLVWSYGFSSIMLLVLSVFFWYLHASNKVTRRRFLYPFVGIVVLYLFFVTGMLALQSAEFVVFKRPFIAIGHCLEAFVVAIVFHDAASRKLSPVSAIALFVGFFGNGPWMVAATIVSVSGVFEGSTAGEWAALALSFATAVVLVLYLLRSATNEPPAASQPGADAAAQRSRKASVAHGLSAKEQEVAQLLYRGLSAKRIAEELYISENTVRTHTANIYRKLDVHSKQDLIKLFDSYED